MTAHSTAAGAGLLDGLTRIAAQAGRAILAARQRDLGLREKADKSPVTAADKASEDVILTELARLSPGIPVVSEEANGNRPVAGLGGAFFIIDPLDGTREFIAGLDEYTVNIALVEGGRAVMGVMAAPSRNLIWRGCIGQGMQTVAQRLPMDAAHDTAGRCTDIRGRPWPASGARVLVSRSHLDPATDAYVDRLTRPERIGCGSALKFCLLAEGSADIYPRLAPTSEWDIAAGDAVVTAAGGRMTRPDGQPLIYGRGNFLVPAFIAAGDASAPLR